MGSLHVFLCAFALYVSPSPPFRTLFSKAMSLIRSTLPSVQKTSLYCTLVNTIGKISMCKQGQRSYDRTGLLHHFPFLFALLLFPPPLFCTLFRKTINLPISTRRACGKHCFTARLSTLLEKYPSPRHHFPFPLPLLFPPSTLPTHSEAFSYGEGWGVHIQLVSLE